MVCVYWRQITEKEIKMYISTEAEEWAEQLFKVGATLDQVKTELTSAFVDPRSDLGCQVIAEFRRLVLDNMEISKRGKAQYQNWK